MRRAILPAAVPLENASLLTYYPDLQRLWSYRGAALLIICPYDGRKGLF